MRVVAFRDDGWFDAVTDEQTWSHLCRAYDVEHILVREWAEASEFVGDAPVYVLDEGGDTELADTVIDSGGVYVFGRTGLDLRRAVPVEAAPTFIRIDTPKPIVMFGHCAGAILLRRAWQSR